jgi:UDP-N-acetylglucosamine--N-acetylmuramyl-(pentapeptide) pyrophosphoryl-undecaprenol N-acetylglucosamine transferase
VTPRRYAVVAGGGTAGHVVPALAVARALAARGHDRASIEFVGSTRGQEATLLEGEEFPLTLLAGRGLSRRLGVADLWANARSLLALAGSTLRALRAMRAWRPKVAVCVGGYASFPAGAAALVLRVPVVVLNIDAVPGRVNRFLGRFAAANAVAFSGTALPRAVVTGTPVRQEILDVDRGPSMRASSRSALGLEPERPTVGVFGGSLGALRINEAAMDLSSRWATRQDRAIYQVTGQRDWETMSARQRERPDDALLHRLVPFEARMDLLYGAVDVMVCRSGAMTVAELAVVGVPSVLVPLPGAPGDHQRANASALVGAGAAVLVDDHQLDGSKLAALLDELFAEPTRLVAMADAAAALARRGAAQAVAELVDAHAR